VYFIEKHIMKTEIRHFALEQLMSKEIITAENVVTILVGGEAAEALVAILLKGGHINILQADALIGRGFNDIIYSAEPVPNPTVDIPYYKLCGCTVCNCTLGGWQTTCSSNVPGQARG
jgi:hypothetical protein